MAETVWVLAEGEMHEGGTVLGVYAERDLARGAFYERLKALAFPVASANEDPETGAIEVMAGCDWLTLEPHPVVGRGELPGGGRRG